MAHLIAVAIVFVVFYYMITVALAIFAPILSFFGVYLGSKSVSDNDCPNGSYRSYDSYETVVFEDGHREDVYNVKSKKHAVAIARQKHNGKVWYVK